MVFFGKQKECNGNCKISIFLEASYLPSHVLLSPQKKDTRRSCAQKAYPIAIGNHVGDPPNNDLIKKEKILLQNEIGITQRDPIRKQEIMWEWDSPNNDFKKSPTAKRKIVKSN